MHVLLQCQDMFVCSPEKYSFISLPFYQTFPMEALHLLHALPNQAVIPFLRGTTIMLFGTAYLISDIKDYFLFDDDQPRTNQPRNQACGQSFLFT